MASEDSRCNETIAVSGDVYDWLDNQASSQDADPEDVARLLLEAHQLLDADGSGQLSFEKNGSVSAEEVEERLDDLDATVHELIEDVRKRIIQLKRETDGKAPVEHTHSELEEGLDTVTDRVESTTDRIDRLDDQLDAGFENYETVLTHLTEETELIADRVDVLARAVIDIRREFQTIATDRASREGLEELKRAANQFGIRSAACEDCSGTVDIALLTAPECPHCKSRFVDVSPGSRFFRSNVLETGSPPALTGSSNDDLANELEEMVDQPASAQAGRDVSSGGGLDE